MNNSEAPPLTEEDIFIWNQSGQYAIEMLKSIRERAGSASSTFRVVELLSHRIVGAMNSLWVLRRNAPHGFGLDGMMVLRGLYDAHLQALYILIDPAQSDSKSVLFVDFQWVEHRVMKIAMGANTSRMAQSIRNSSLRAMAEPRQDAEYERVVAAYRTRKGRLQRNWYPGTLRDLAVRLGSDTESEYLILQPHLSSAVHSSPHRLLTGPTLSDDTLLMIGWHFTFRVIGKFAECLNVQMGSEYEDLTLPSYRNFFDGPTRE